MKALLYKDFLMLRKKGKMFLGFTVIFALFGVVEENVFFFSLLSCLYPSMAVITLLGLEEQAKWAGYGVLLPVSRKVQTAEKYLFSVLGLLAGILINLIFNLVGGTNTRDFLDVLPVILIVGLLFAAFELPLIYKVGIGKAKLGYLFLAGLPSRPWPFLQGSREKIPRPGGSSSPGRCSGAEPPLPSGFSWCRWSFP